IFLLTLIRGSVRSPTAQFITAAMSKTVQAINAASATTARAEKSFTLISKTISFANSWFVSQAAPLGSRVPINREPLRESASALAWFFDTWAVQVRDSHSDGTLSNLPVRIGTKGSRLRKKS